MFAALPALAQSQDLEPRAYIAAPVGLRSVVVAAGHSAGGVVVDSSLPIEDVKASVNTLSFGAGRTFDLFGRTALAVVVIPYAWAHASGSVGEVAREASRSGIADPRVRLSVNLLGGRALTAREFATASRPTILGVSLTVAPGLGRYLPSKLINIGANRWSIKPEVGVSHAIGKWTLESYAGVWMFTANDAFYPGSSVRTQQPIATLQGHASYTFKPRLWIAANATWYSGGTTTIDEVRKADLQRNARLGVTASFPLPRRQALKVAISTGAKTRIGADFKTVVAAWQLSWIR